jgi:hypothetical protein
VRAYFVADRIEWASVRPWHAGFRERFDMSFGSYPGSFSFESFRSAGAVAETVGFHYTRHHLPPYHGSSFWEKLGFGVVRGTRIEPTVDKVRTVNFQGRPGHIIPVWDHFGLAVPFWLFAIVFGGLPARQLSGTRRSVRAERDVEDRAGGGRKERLPGRKT